MPNPKQVREGNRDRQADLRARRNIEGLTEVRGVWLPPAEHTHLKKLGKRLREQAERRANGRPLAGS
jgi:hypothetical protein